MKLYLRSAAQPGQPLEIIARGEAEGVVGDFFFTIHPGESIYGLRYDEVLQQIDEQGYAEIKD